MAAMIKNGKGATAESLAVAEHALRVKEAALGREHLESARSLHGLGLVQLNRGEFSRALASHTRALEIRRTGRLDEDAWLTAST